MRSFDMCCWIVNLVYVDCLFYSCCNK